MNNINLRVKGNIILEHKLWCGSVRGKRSSMAEMLSVRSVYCSAESTLEGVWCSSCRIRGARAWIYAVEISLSLWLNMDSRVWIHWIRTWKENIAWANTFCMNNVLTNLFCFPFQIYIIFIYWCYKYLSYEYSFIFLAYNIIGKDY